MSQIELEHVCLDYFSPKGEVAVLRDVSLAIPRGQFVSVVGPSGCGKTTLLSLISGVLRPTQGQVRIDGQVVTGPARQAGYMLQRDHLLEWRDVLGNVLVGAEVRRMDPRAARRRALELLARYGLSDFVHSRPSELSGGMRQRVALIRTLVLEPEILLLDEPFSALDYQTRLALNEEMTAILRRENKTVVMVTHDISEAITMADRVVVMSRRPSRPKADHLIRFQGGRLLPFQARQAPEFNGYFDLIWRELDIHVDIPTS